MARYRCVDATSPSVGEESSETGTDGDSPCWPLNLALAKPNTAFNVSAMRVADCTPSSNHLAPSGGSWNRLAFSPSGPRTEVRATFTGRVRGRISSGPRLTPGIDVLF